MAGKPKPMSQIKQIFRLRQQGQSRKAIARICAVSRTTVKKYLALLKKNAMSIEEALEKEDPVLEQMLQQSEVKERHLDVRYAYLESQYEYFLEELKRTGVNRWVLWNEYRRQHPCGYSYSQFCWHLQQLDKMRKISMSQQYSPGEKLFIDFAGKPLEWIDPETGEVKKAQVFVATLGYSKYSYIEAVRSQKAEDFLMALVRCFIFFGGVPAVVVPDNLKAAVTRTDPYEPDINRLLEDLANHFGIAVIPARSGKPKDKALVENQVKNAYSHIYAPLRNRQFYSLEELNQAIKEQLLWFNDKDFQGRDYSRRDLFDRHEKAALKELPVAPFEIKKYREITVQKNSHIYLAEDRHYYSVPYAFTGQKVKIIYTPNLVSIYCKGNRIAAHYRNNKAHGYTTVREHLPSHHQRWLDRNPEYYMEWARKISPETAQVIQKILRSKPHVEQAYKSCEGLLGLVRRHGKELVTKACQRALELDCCNYGFISRIIQSGMLNQFQEDIKPLPHHENVRGEEYYKQMLNSNNQ
jgi:transposase